MSTTGSPILWQNETGDITLLDIPRSISAAQGTTERPCHDLLISSEPLQEPYPTDEPKSKKAKSKLRNNTVSKELHNVYKDVLEKAVGAVRQHHDTPWALERPFIVSSDKDTGEKRKLDDRDLPSEDDATPVTSRTRTEGTMPSNVLPNPPVRKVARLELSDTKEPCQICELDDPRFQTNCSPIMLPNQRVPHCKGFTGPSDDLRIPTHASFYTGNCVKGSRTFHNAIRHQASEHETRRHFDFILLDPPWPNRSVKRTYQTPGAGYEILKSVDEIYDLLLKMDLDMLMADDCLVGVWITNKQAIREMMLGEDGIFDQWGVELQEEWIWLKTTLHGETVTPMDSIMRKPYEVLLLGRKRPRGAESNSEGANAVKRRVIIAVPDLHSRKPCLKELIEPMMPDRKDYRALEVFARHLVAGWWSWGNECTKFNRDDHWRKAEGFEKTGMDAL